MNDSKGTTDSLLVFLEGCLFLSVIYGMLQSELLTKLLDYVAHNPSELRMRDVADLSVEELAVYMKFHAEQMSDPESELAKHAKAKAPAPVRDILGE